MSFWLLMQLLSLHDFAYKPQTTSKLETSCSPQCGEVQLVGLHASTMWIVLLVYALFNKDKCTAWKLWLITFKTVPWFGYSKKIHISQTEKLATPSVWGNVSLLISSWTEIYSVAIVCQLHLIMSWFLKIFISQFWKENILNTHWTVIHIYFLILKLNRYILIHSLSDSNPCSQTLSSFNADPPPSTPSAPDNSHPLPMPTSAPLLDISCSLCERHLRVERSQYSLGMCVTTAVRFCWILFLVWIYICLSIHQLVDSCAVSTVSYNE